jgi:hypothetical protein
VAAARLDDTPGGDVARARRRARDGVVSKIAELATAIRTVANIANTRTVTVGVCSAFPSASARSSFVDAGTVVLTLGSKVAAGAGATR